MSYGPLGFMKRMDMGTYGWNGYDGRGFFCIPICKRVNEVAPPTTFGTEEWTARTPVGPMWLTEHANPTRLKRGSCASVERQRIVWE
jgi:hypothetical protein